MDINRLKQNLLMKKILFKHSLLPVFFGLCLLLVSCTDSVAPIYQGPDIQILQQTGHKDLEAQFQRYSYKLDALEQGVPPLILTAMPADLGDIHSSKKRKTIFFKALLPMILLANEEIRFERYQVQKTQQHLENFGKLSPDQRHILATLAQRYEVDYDPASPEKTVERLLKRVDIIPADLALAQAANESAWGTSRFSRVANNLFGEWTFIQGQGIVPEGRPEGETYEIQKFPTVYDSVKSYLHNLNTHPAYRQLRTIRAEIRSAGSKPSGVVLAEGLLRYSIRGMDYVRELQAMIRKNRLERFAGAKLRVST